MNVENGTTIEANNSMVTTTPPCPQHAMNAPTMVEDTLMTQLSDNDNVPQVGGGNASHKGPDFSKTETAKASAAQHGEKGCAQYEVNMTSAVAHRPYVSDLKPCALPYTPPKVKQLTRAKSECAVPTSNSFEILEEVVELSPQFSPTSADLPNSRHQELLAMLHDTANDGDLAEEACKVLCANDAPPPTHLESPFDIPQLEWGMQELQDTDALPLRRAAPYGDATLTSSVKCLTSASRSDAQDCQAPPGSSQEKTCGASSSAPENAHNTTCPECVEVDGVPGFPGIVHDEELCRAHKIGWRPPTPPKKSGAGGSTPKEDEESAVSGPSNLTRGDLESTIEAEAEDSEIEFVEVTDLTEPVTKIVLDATIRTRTNPPRKKRKLR